MMVTFETKMVITFETKMVITFETMVELLALRHAVDHYVMLVSPDISASFCDHC